MSFSKISRELAQLYSLNLIVWCHTGQNEHLIMRHVIIKDSVNIFTT